MASLTQREEYSRYYGDFRGVDFSSDHTQVLEQRLAYSVNMYKDYQSGKGGGIETIPGFRRRFQLEKDNNVYGIHTFKTRLGFRSVLVHVGCHLYEWAYPFDANIKKTVSIPLPEAESDNKYVINLNSYLEVVANVSKVSPNENTNAELQFTFDKTDRYLTVYTMGLATQGDYISIEYYESEITDESTSDARLWSDMAFRKSESFVFNNKLYIIDGKNYLCFDGDNLTDVRDNAYIPTTYKNIIPSGENANTGLEYEERNIIQPKFKHTFIGDGVTTKFHMNEKNLESIDSVLVYGETATYEKDLVAGTITFAEAPKKPINVGYPENYAGVEITASKTYDSSLITNCTIAAIFDERVFLSGNPDHPNNIYFCGRNNATGFTDPTYFPATNFVRDGVGNAKITGLIPVADTLMALKEDTQQDGSVYFHSEKSTGEDLHPKDYPSSRGLAGTGCLGACINFLDDPVFVSRRGLEGISKLQIASERSIEHRSSLIDAKLVNLGAEALKNAVLEEWNGYLLLLLDGKIFMADSRQMYTNEIGIAQYEWYYLEDIGVYSGAWKEYEYSIDMPEMLVDKTVYVGGKSYKLSLSNTPRAIVNATENVTIYDGWYNDGNNMRFGYNFVVQDGKAYLCEPTGAMTGGMFKKAVTLKVIDDNILFGTSNGVICSFNFDKRDKYGEIATKYYSFDGRTIFSGAATKMDSCGIPHLTKSTVKKSTVIKTKAIPSSTVKVKVRTNAKPYEQVARISASRFDFDDMDFADFSFVVEEDTIFSVKEREKNWVEKQYYVYSDEYLKPLSLFYITYRYNIAGRIK